MYIYICVYIHLFIYIDSWLGRGKLNAFPKSFLCGLLCSHIRGLAAAEDGPIHFISGQDNTNMAAVSMMAKGCIVA